MKRGQHNGGVHKGVHRNRTAGHLQHRWFVCGFVCLAVFLCSIYVSIIQAKIYYDADEDYILKPEKSEYRKRGHYLEFVNADEERYTVQVGDTLWGIAQKYYGSSTYYTKLWEDNKDTIETPEGMQIGTKLKLPERLYTGAGMQDIVQKDLMHVSVQHASAWDWDPDGASYQMFQMMTQRNDLGENDPFRCWEEFKQEAEDCSRRVCDDRVSELSFARYRVTDLCDMCYYQFVFDGGSKKYLIMAAFAYTDDRISDEFVLFKRKEEQLPFGCANLKSEIFTVCDLSRCSEADLRVAKGKTFYEVARCIDSGKYWEKGEDYVGAKDWKYDQLHNPFTQAMRSLYDGPLERVTDDSDNREITWKDPVMEKLVREELARLWQLTDEEKKTFMERPMTRADLAGIDSLYLHSSQKYEEYGNVALRLNCYKEFRGMSTLDRDKGECVEYAAFTTLDDLANFTELTRLDMHLYWSDFTDFSAIGKIAGLRELSIYMESMQSRIEDKDIAFLGELTNLRLLELWGYDRLLVGIQTTQSFEEITDLSVLTNCPRLKYLLLATGNVENYDFLKELPELYYIYLLGEREMKNVRPDTALLPNAGYIYYYHEEIYRDIGRERR